MPARAVPATPIGKDRLVSCHASPNSLRRRTNQPYCLRTLPYLSVNLSHTTPTSELHRVLAGVMGVSLTPIVRRSHLNHVSPVVLSAGSSKVQWRIISLTLYNHYTILTMNVKSFLLTRRPLLPSASDPLRAVVSTYCQDLVSFSIDHLFVVYSHGRPLQDIIVTALSGAVLFTVLVVSLSLFDSDPCGIECFHRHSITG